MLKPSIPRRARCAILVVVACAAHVACGDDAPPQAEPPPARTVSPPVFGPPDTSTAPAAPQPERGCVGPGSTREDVLRIMGEPDTIVGGWWYYGRTQFHLGSGTVQDYINGGGVPLCGG